jgi:hypothetical protein
MTHVLVQTHSIRDRVCVGRIRLVAAVWHRMELRRFNGSGNVKVVETVVKVLRIQNLPIVYLTASTITILRRNIRVRPTMLVSSCAHDWCSDWCFWWRLRWLVQVLCIIFTFVLPEVDETIGTGVYERCLWLMEWIRGMLLGLCGNVEIYRQIKTIQIKFELSDLVSIRR